MCKPTVHGRNPHLPPTPWVLPGKPERTDEPALPQVDTGGHPLHLGDVVPKAAEVEIQFVLQERDAASTNATSCVHRDTTYKRPRTCCPKAEPCGVVDWFELLVCVCHCVSKMMGHPKEITVFWKEKNLTSLVGGNIVYMFC